MGNQKELIECMEKLTPEYKYDTLSLLLEVYRNSYNVVKYSSEPRPKEELLKCLGSLFDVDNKNDCWITNYYVLCYAMKSLVKLINDDIFYLSEDLPNKYKKLKELMCNKENIKYLKELTLKDVDIDNERWLLSLGDDKYCSCNQTAIITRLVPSIRLLERAYGLHGTQCVIMVLEIYMKSKVDDEVPRYAPNNIAQLHILLNDVCRLKIFDRLHENERFSWNSIEHAFDKYSNLREQYNGALILRDDGNVYEMIKDIHEMMSYSLKLKRCTFIPALIYALISKYNLQLKL